MPVPQEYTDKITLNSEFIKRESEIEFLVSQEITELVCAKLYEERRFKAEPEDITAEILRAAMENVVSKLKVAA